MFLLLLALFEGEVFLVGIDAGSLGRGSTGLAYPSNGYKNPAAALLLDPFVSFTGSKMFGDLANVVCGGLNLRQDKYGFGLHFIFHSVGDISDTRNAWEDLDGDGIPDPGEPFYNDLISSFSSREGGVFTTYSRWLGNFSVGMGLKFIYKEIDSVVALGAGADIGFIYQMEAYSIGAAIKDITTSPIYWEGRTEHIAPSYQIGIGFNKEIGEIPIFAEVDLIQDDYGFNHHLGLEVGMNDWLNLRIGFINSDQLTTGFGVSKVRFLVDYAVNVHRDMLSSHRVSLMYKL